MDYRDQATFLRTHRIRALPAAAGAGLLIAGAWIPLASLAWACFATALGVGLLWGAYYLPLYLSLTANLRRRLRWLERARYFFVVTLAVVAILLRSWGALAVTLVAASAHFGLRRRLQHALPIEPEGAKSSGTVQLAVCYAMFDVVLLWLLQQKGLPGPLSAELLITSIFLAALLLRPGSVASRTGLSLATAACTHLLTGRSLLGLGSLLWTFASLHLLGHAEKQNQRNFRCLVSNLVDFSGKNREEVVFLLNNATRLLAENWRRDRPVGQEEVSRWYSGNARFYLYDISQHHLMYRHISYTLGLLRLARGRVLDFGGGNGDFSCALAREGFDTTYFDVPGESASFLRWRVQREALPLRIIHDPQALDGPFDVVFCLDVLEHLVDIRPVLARLGSLLQPGGRLLGTYYYGPASSAPMHIDPGFDTRAYLLGEGFLDVKRKVVGWTSPGLIRKRLFIVLEKAPG